MLGRCVREEGSLQLLDPHWWRCLKFLRPQQMLSSATSDCHPIPLIFTVLCNLYLERGCYSRKRLRTILMRFEEEVKRLRSNKAKNKLHGGNKYIYVYIYVCIYSKSAEFSIVRNTVTGCTNCSFKPDSHQISKLLF